jgi:peptidyl-dipeptidase A
VYYQNYLLGELTASQFDAALRRNGPTTLFNEETGRFFLEKVFHPGDRSGWQRLIEEATGEPLNP